MSLILTEDLKEAVGILPADTTKDVVLANSVRTANALIAGYIGFDLSDTDTLRTFIDTIENNARHILLPAFPIIEVAALSANGLPVLVDNYWVNNRIGIVDFSPGNFSYGAGGMRFGHRVAVVYRAGYEEIPEDLQMACLNIAAALYNMGGTFASAASGGTGELKSLTMFDAMSMSFDVGGTSATGEAAGSPIAMINSWKFVLDKYRVSQPTLR